MISRRTYDRLRYKIEAHERARKAYDPEGYRRGRGYDARDMKAIEEMSGVAWPTNEERSQVEVYEFFHDPPDRYFVYVDPQFKKVRTWMGDVLGDILWTGSEYRSPMGDRRRNIRVLGINGVMYSGTCYVSAGDYCRIRKMSAKAQRRETKRLMMP